MTYENHSPGQLPILKRRKLRFLPRGADTGERAVREISRLAGVSSVLSAGDGVLLVEYDLSRVTLEQLERVVAGADLLLKGGLYRLQRGWWKFEERNELDNILHAGSGTCCNRPPPRAR